MRQTKLSLALIILTIFINTQAFAQNSTAKNSFAVLEFFTSEGCSSCPPADQLLGKIQNEYRNQNLYLLAYHVDYWDRLGWKDTFSKAEFSARQYQYGKWFNSRQIYTPQLVINGQTDNIASDEPVVRNAITKAFSKSAKLGLNLNSVQNKNSLTLTYTINEVAKSSKLLIAIVQKRATNHIKRGENSGRTLVHHQIVRQLQTINLNATSKGTVTLEIPKEFNPAAFEIIGFVQDQIDGKITAATKVNL